MKLNSVDPWTTLQELNEKLYLNEETCRKSEELFDEAQKLQSLKTVPKLAGSIYHACQKTGDLRTRSMIIDRVQKVHPGYGYNGARSQRYRSRLKRSMKSVEKKLDNRKGKMADGNGFNGLTGYLDTVQVFVRNEASTGFDNEFYNDYRRVVNYLESESSEWVGRNPLVVDAAVFSLMQEVVSVTELSSVLCVGRQAVVENKRLFRKELK